MKKFLILALFAIAAWQASKHYGDLFHRHPKNEGVVRNESSGPIERVRFSVGSQTFVKEVLARQEQVVYPFSVGHDETFRLQWQTAGGVEERSWRGGLAAEGPLLQSYHFTIGDHGAVVYAAERL